MDDDLIRGYERWRAADEGGRDDEADAAFRTVFAAVPTAEPSLTFELRTMEAVVAASGRDAVRRRRAVAGMVAAAVLLGAVTLYFTAGLVASGISAVVLGGLDLLVGAIVAAASASDGGLTVWSVVASLGRAMAAFMTDPKTTFALVAIQGVAIAALIALQRLLGADGESLR
jgi:hypothetical protein